MAPAPETTSVASSFIPDKGDGGAAGLSCLSCCGSYCQSSVRNGKAGRLREPVRLPGQKSRKQYLTATGLSTASEDTFTHFCPGTTKASASWKTLSSPAISNPSRPCHGLKPLRSLSKRSTASFPTISISRKTGPSQSMLPNPYVLLRASHASLCPTSFLRQGCIWMSS